MEQSKKRESYVTSKMLHVSKPVLKGTSDFIFTFEEVVSDDLLKCLNDNAVHFDIHSLAYLLPAPIRHIIGTLMSILELSLPPVIVFLFIIFYVCDSKAIAFHKH